MSVRWPSATLLQSFAMMLSRVSNHQAKLTTEWCSAASTSLVDNAFIAKQEIEALVVLVPLTTTTSSSIFHIIVVAAINKVGCW